MEIAKLGDLEKKVMDIVWEKKKCTTRDIVLNLKTNRHLAYTTVATILQRLWKKGLVIRKENKSGYIYTPKVSKEKYSKSIAQSFLKSFINSYGDIAIASFVDSIEKLPSAKRNHLLKLLEEHDKSK